MNANEEPKRLWAWGKWLVLQDEPAGRVYVVDDEWVERGELFTLPAGATMDEIRRYAPWAVALQEREGNTQYKAGMRDGAESVRHQVQELLGLSRIAAALETVGRNLSSLR